MSGPSYIKYYAESLGHGRGQMRVDMVIDGELVESYIEGSPAPLETVRKYEETITLKPGQSVVDARNERTL